MKRSPRRTRAPLFRRLALLLALAAPAAASAGPLLERQLSVDLGQLVLAAEPPPKPPDLTLDFDLLDAPAPPAVKIDDAAMKQRRSMLDLHQKAGLGLLALELATTVVGQLNYNDKYGANAPVTGRYELSHTVLAYSTLGVFAATGAIALFAPANPVKKTQYDRLTLHKVGMALATAGMVAQGVVGIYADSREGRIDQAQIAKTHLVIGYATLAAVGVAVGALIF